MIATSDIELDSLLAANKPFAYPGDIEDTSPPLNSSGYTCLKFEDPAEMVCYYNLDIRNGTLGPDGKPINLHPWQSKLHVSLTAARPTSQKPHKFCLVASNGSGKDAFIVAPFAIWFILCKIQSRVIVTSASGTQLTAQTEGYIRDLAQRINDEMGVEYFRIRQRYIKCLLSGSEIRLFATDEAGKAEGYHPMVPNAEMAIIVNEGKSVTEEIHNALSRCTGFNYWLEVSTPGEPLGFFYYAATNWKNTLRITSFDCPHISSDEIDDDRIRLGEESALFRSKHMALFTSIGGEVIITTETLEKLLKNPPSFSIIDWPDRIGIDLAAGGDETVLCFTKGNRCIKEEFFTEVDTTVTADRIEQILIANKIPKNHPHIYADDGGVGHAIIDILIRRGWNINRVLNQWAAVNKKQYGNRGAENWYRVARLLEEQMFDVSSLSEKTRKQLVTRKYKKALLGARIFLESKKEAKAHGRPSPDRADAFILSQTGLTLDDYLKAKTIHKVNGVTIVSNRDKEESTPADDIEQFYADNFTYKNYQNNGKTVKQKRIFGSLKLATHYEN